MGIRRGEAKTPGGKLVAATVHADESGTPIACRLDGDFFIDCIDCTDDDAQMRSLITDLERTLLACVRESVQLEPTSAAARHDGGNCLDRWRDAVRQACSRHGQVRLVGTDSDAIALALARAVGLVTAHDDHEPPAMDARPDSDWEQRWLNLRPIVVHDIPRSPAEQMAVDEQWAREVAVGTRPATLRFWEWSAPAIVVGRFQSIPDEVHVDEAERQGFAIVRRCTGGGAMVVQPGGAITYSLYAPQWFVDGVDAAESYRLCDGWLVDALCRLGAAADFRGLNDIAVADEASQWGKAGGAAQRRFPAPRGSGPGAVLHHTTLAYTLDGGLMARLLRISPEKLSDKAVRSAAKRVMPLDTQPALRRLGRDGLLDALVQAVSCWSAMQSRTRIAVGDLQSIRGLPLPDGVQ